MSTRSATRRPTRRARLKTWPAYLLTVCFPGTGHLYAREWKRGLSWAALCGVALVFLSSGTLLTDGSLTEPIIVTALRLEHTTFADMAFPLTVIILSVVDLYALSGRSSEPY
ncbi:hypothetical protein [Natronorubrum thiooxidans]|uniref:Uncharacterized protein n=1 Tax=Natronorubrum thiooxidans TaxID=308853 RepID=A0A1N7GCU6_9EURY|nr:hypothetical protein [Natronorubrum thiooxidans]SIS10346.1 hypothetical protein SAMN05421752_11155 [Natronorubrum thiooxidans]